jgi:hypothetical protein
VPVELLGPAWPLGDSSTVGSLMKQKEHSGLWLLTVRWSRTTLLKLPDSLPTLDKAVVQGAPFIASGRRHESDNYLFVDRIDAEFFKERIEDKLKSKPSSKWKASVDVVEVTPEDVAHLDLDPAQRKTRNTKA